MGSLSFEFWQELRTRLSFDRCVETMQYKFYYNLDFICSKLCRLNSTCYHPPRYTPGICQFFLLDCLFPTLGHAERDNSLSLGLSIGHTLHSHTKLFVCKIKIKRFIFVQNHTINIPDIHAVHSTSTPKPMFYFNSRFSRFVRWISRYSF